MSDSHQESVTELLGAVQRGENAAIEKLFARVYDELHRIAKLNRRNWVGDYTMNTTALVHEAYIKLAGQENHNWTNRSHFMGVAAKAMRHIMINYAQKRNTKKRGGDVKKVSLEEQSPDEEIAIPMSEAHADKLLALEKALKKLEKTNERQVKMIECKFFGGMSNEETATSLGISTSTVKRDWAMAQAWLYREASEDID